MASFQFTTQMQGPQIDENLLVNAAKVGTEIGKATPSGFAAAVEGISKGISQGMDWVSSYENIELTKQRQRLTELQIQAQAVRTNEAVANEQYSTAADRAMLEQKRVESENAVIETKRYNEFIDAYQQAPTADAKFDLITNSPWIFNSEKSKVFGDNLLKAVTAMPDLSMSRRNYMAKQTQAAAQQRAAEAQAAKIAEARNAFASHNSTDSIMAMTGMSPEAIATQTELVRSDSFVTGPDGNFVVDKNTNRPIVQQPTGQATDYILFSKRPDGTRGNVLARGIPADYYKVWQLGGQAYRQDTPQADANRAVQITSRIPNAGQMAPQGRQLQQQPQAPITSGLGRSAIESGKTSQPVVDPRPSKIDKVTEVINTGRVANYNKVADKSSTMPVSPAAVKMIDSVSLVDSAGKFNLSENSQAATVLYRALGMPMGYSMTAKPSTSDEMEMQALTNSLLGGIQASVTDTGAASFGNVTTNAEITEISLDSTSKFLALKAARMEAQRSGRLSSLAYANGTEDLEIINSRARTIESTIIRPYVDKLRARASEQVHAYLRNKSVSDDIIARIK